MDRRAPNDREPMDATAQRRRRWHAFFRPDTARTSYLSAVAAALGLLCGLVAVLFEKLIGLFTNAFFFGRLSLAFLEPVHNGLGWLVVLVPAAGGLIVGLLIRYGSERLKGDGIPEAMEAIVRNESRIPVKIAVLKPLTSALTIGSGGPFGAEGPIIQTGGAVGSVLGQILRVTASERRILLAAGAAAGLSATYGTPIAAVILAIELLLFEFRTRSFIPCVVATSVATAFRFRVLGTAPMFSVRMGGDFGTLSEMPLFLALGIVAGVFAVVISRGLYSTEEWFDRLRIPVAAKPALGGLVVGLIAVAEPRVLGVGYAEIRGEILGQFAFTALVVMLAAKVIAWWAALGSGQAGGVLAPMLMLGGAIGGAFGILSREALPGIAAGSGMFALAAAAAVFGATTRATFAAIVFGMEITRSFESVLPLMITCVAADAVCYAIEEHSILTRKLAERGVLVAHELVVDPLGLVLVREVMTKEVETVSTETRVGELLGRMTDPAAGKHQGYPVLDPEGNLFGIVTRSDLIRPGVRESQTMAEVASAPPVTCSPDEPLEDVVARMAQREIGHLPVVSADEPRRLAGYLSRSDILKARRRRRGEDHFSRNR